MTVSVAALVGHESATDQSDDHLAELLADRPVKGIAMRAGTMIAAVREQLLKMIDVLDPPPAVTDRSP
ncbi:hypothetical protein [Rhodococcus sovatensis]|uniref:Transposase n=1 Tax=Rhodococcus sovatensis TaxID=1805840 RepID=A0ABZ2PR67_9NOCA